MTDVEVRGIIEGAGAACWNELDSALLRAVDELQSHAEIGDATWEVLRSSYDDLQLLEVPVVVGQYQLVAYFTNTIGVEVSPDLPRLPGA